MSDEHSIIVNFKNGIIFKMGNWSDVEYKLNLAETVMDDDDVKGKKGYLRMIGSNQCSFRMTDGPVITVGKTEPTTEPATDEYGNPVVRGEQNPDQEAIFNRANGQESTTTAAANDWNDYNDYSQWQDDSGYADYSEQNGYDDGSYSQW